MSVYVFHVPNARSTFTRASNRLCLLFLYDFPVAPALSGTCVIPLALILVLKRPSSRYSLIIPPSASSLTKFGILHSILHTIHLPFLIPTAIYNSYLTFTCVVIAELQHGPAACLPYINRAVASTTQFSTPLLPSLPPFLPQSLDRPHSPTN